MPQLVTNQQVILIHTHNLAIYLHDGRGQQESNYIHIDLVYLDPCWSEHLLLAVHYLLRLEG